MSEDSIISLSNVNKWFGDFQVLKDINLLLLPTFVIPAVITNTKLCPIVKLKRKSLQNPERLKRN